MQDDISYRTSAVRYNEEMAIAADKLAKELAHPTIQRWCESVAKQHRRHAKRHRRALARLEANKKATLGGEPSAPVESAPDQTQAADPVENAPEPKHTPTPADVMGRRIEKQGASV